MQSTGVGNVRSECRMQPRARMGTIEKQGDDGGGCGRTVVTSRMSSRAKVPMWSHPKFVQGDETLGRTRKAPWGGAGQWLRRARLRRELRIAHHPSPQGGPRPPTPDLRVRSPVVRAPAADGQAGARGREGGGAK